MAPRVADIRVLTLTEKLHQATGRYLGSNPNWGRLVLCLYLHASYLSMPTLDHPLNDANYEHLFWVGKKKAASIKLKRGFCFMSPPKDRDG